MTGPDTSLRTPREIPSRRLTKSRTKARRRVAMFEFLEQRQLLATFVWDGGGANDFWSTPENWVGNVAPTGDGTDDLVFTGTARTSNVNSYPIGATFNSIAFNASGGAGNFVLNGNAIVLNGGIDIDSSAGNQAINLPMVVEVATTFNVAAGNLSLGGALGGGGSITKTGAGSLAFGSVVSVPTVNAAGGDITFSSQTVNSGAFASVLTGSGPVGTNVPANNGLLPNIALASNGAVPFSASDIGVPPHSTDNLNDGLYGNSESWIGGGNPLAGIDLPGTGVFSVSGIAFGRANNLSHTDRSDGTYTLYRTLIPNPNTSLPITGDPATGWESMGTIIVTGNAIRKTYAVTQGGAPVAMTGLMMLTPAGAALDEIEVHGTTFGPIVTPNVNASGSGTLHIPSSSVIGQLNITGAGAMVSLGGAVPVGAGAYQMTQILDGPTGTVVPANLALASYGSTAFASAVVPNLAAHTIPGLNDGLYGNANSWIGSFSSNTLAGIDLEGTRPYAVSSFSFGRSNTGAHTDRSDGVYTVYRTLVANPNSTLTITGNPETGWESMGTITVAADSIRKTYSLTRGGVAVNMTGIMLGVPTNGAIDEIEVHGIASPAGPINLPTTSINVSASSTLNVGLNAAQPILAAINISGAGTTLNLKGAPTNSTGSYSIINTSTGPTGAAAPTNNGVYNNLALASNGAVAFANGTVAGYPSTHAVPHLNDGLYGNSSSWIGAGGTPGLAGISLPKGLVYNVNSIAFGRDNTPFYNDRSDGVYTLYRTLVPNAGASLAITGDATTGWEAMGTVTVAGTAIKKTFSISQGGTAVAMTGLMIGGPGDAAIDEIEIYGTSESRSQSPIVIGVPTSGPTVPGGNPVPTNNGTLDNIALASAGGTAFASAVIPGYAPAHTIAGLNNGLYGNGQSWIGSFSTITYAGIDLPGNGAFSVSSVAFGRNNDSTTPPIYSDRSNGTYVFYRTTVPNPTSALPITGDPSTGWQVMGSVTVNGNAIKKTYAISQDGAPVVMTGFMMQVPVDGAIDEIEIYGSPIALSPVGQASLAGPVILPNTAINVSATSNLNLGVASANHQLGVLTLSGAASGTNFTLQNGANVTFANIVAAGAAGTTSSLSGTPRVQSLAGTVDVATGTQLTINSIIDGATLTKTGGGTLVLTGANIYTGLTTVTGGTLSLARPTAGNTIPGDILVTAGNLSLAAPNQIADTASITINAGAMATNLNAETVANLTINSTTLSVLSNLTVSNLLSVTAGTHDIGSNASLTANTVTLSGGSNLRMGANSNPTTINVGAGGLTMNGATIQFGNPGGAAFAATLNLGGNFTGTGTNLFDLQTAAASLNLSGATRTFNVTGGTTTVEVPIVGTGGLTKTGAGTFALTGAGANSYNGLTTLSAGTLSLNKSAGTTAIPGDVLVSGGTLSLAAANQIADAATMTINAGALTTNSNAETVTNVTIHSTTLSVLSNLTVSNLLNITAGIHDVGSNSSLTANTLTLSGGSNLRMGANSNPTTINVGSGGLTMNGATIQFGNPGAAGFASTLNLGGNFTGSGTNLFALQTAPASLNLGATSRTFDVTGGTTTVEVPIVGGAGLTKNGAGTLLLSGNNSYAGTTTINAGIVTLAGGNAIANAGTVVLVNTAGATLNLTASETIGSLSGGGAAGGNITLNANTLTAGDSSSTVYSGSISGSGGLTKVGSGTLELAGASSYGGTTTLSAGVLRISHGDALGAASGITNIVGNTGGTGVLELVGGITVAEPIQLEARQAASALVDHIRNVAGANTLTGTITGATGGSEYNLNAASGSLSITNNVHNANGPTRNLNLRGTATGSISGNITGSWVLNVLDAGTWTISGNNTYAGGTNVNAGRLLVNNTIGSGTGNGLVTVSNGATLGGTGSSTGSVTINGTLAPGHAGLPGIYTIGGSLSFGAASTFEAQINGTTPGSQHDQVIVGGNVSIATGAGTNFSTSVLVAPPATITLILNNSATNITGEFNGLVDEQALFVNGQKYYVSYHSPRPAGNDFALIRNNIVVANDDDYGTILMGEAFSDNVFTNPNPDGPDVDDDSDGVFSIVTPPAHGTLVLDPLTGDFTYTPAANYKGPDSFVYRLFDGEFSDTATVSFTLSQFVVSAEGVLFVAGSSASERVVINPGPTVRINNVPYGPFSDATSVVVYGNAGDDTMSVASNLGMSVALFGDAGNDYLAGGTADDILDGGEGNDRLIGGGGNDLLLGGGGTDTLAGGGGNDILYGDQYLTRERDQLLSTKQAKDTLNGDGGDDQLYGDGGNDILNGGLGSDYIDGGADNDTLDGGEGNDFLFGGLGSDKLLGRAGADVLIGGSGADQLLGGNSADLLYGSNLETEDYQTLMDMAVMWFAGNQQDAVDAFSAAALAPSSTYDTGDDRVADTLHGEGDSDWYLIFKLDAISALEKFPANTKTVLM